MKRIIKTRILQLFVLMPTILINCCFGINYNFPFLVQLPEENGDLGSYPWKVIWDANGIAHVSKDRLWLWNGSNWVVKGPENLEDLKDITFGPLGQLWAVGYNSVGYFEKTNYRYHSILDWLPIDYRSFGEAWEINVDEKYVWISTHNRLIKFNQNEFYHWEFTAKDRVIFFFIKSGIYAHVPSEGIYKISGNKLELICSGKSVTKNAILYLEDLKESIVRAISGDQLIELNTNTKEITRLINFNTRINGLSAVAKLPSGNYVLGTLGRGLKFLRPDGVFYNEFGESSELGSLIILYMATDINGNLWILHTNGIILIHTEKIQINHLKDSKLFDGIIRSVKFQDGRIIFGTSSGLKEISNNNSFEVSVLEICDGEINQIRERKGKLLVDDYNTILEVSGSYTSRLYEFDQEITNFDYTENGILHLAFIGALKSYREIGKNKLREINTINTENSVRYLETDGEGITWGWSERSPLYEILVSADDAVRVRVHREVLNRELTLESSNITITKKGPVILHRNSIIRRNFYNGEWDAEILQTQLGEPLAIEFKRTESGLIGWLIYWSEDKGSNLLVKVNWPDDSRPEWEIIPWIDMTELGKIHMIEYYEQDEPMLVIIGMKGILIANPELSRLVPPPGKPLIWWADGNLVVSESEEFLYKEQLNRFQFSTPGSEIYYPVRYQTRIIGLDNKWSAPTKFTDKEIGHLLEGEYRFEVRAMDPFGRHGPATGIDLVIFPPWYKTGVAYLLLIIGCIVLVVGIALGYARYKVYRLRNRQIELEGLVRDRTLELNKANAIKDDFIANLSHEIRNPLNGVIGLIRQLNEGAVPRRENIQALKGAANYLHRTVEDVLDFAKLETGEVSVIKDAFDIEEVLAGVVQIYRQQAEDKGILIDCLVWNPNNNLVVSDQGKIQQILANLINNAVKFTDSGSIKVDLQLISYRKTSKIEIRIEDTGCGISRSDQLKVFDKFYQVKSRNHKTTGTGLGLTLVKKFTDLLGGDLKVRSHVGSGTEFTVIIPVKLQERKPKEDMRMDNLDLRVLVVEDLEFNRLHLGEFLQRSGCVVQVSDNGLEALEIACKDPFDVILLDWELPGLSGYEIAKRLRKNPNFEQSTRIISMTAYATKDIKEKCFKVGMNAFLSKPLDHIQLYRELLRRYLKSAGNLAEMEFGGDWQSHKQRWLNVFQKQIVTVDDAFAMSDIKSVEREAHKLLGHIRMIKTVEIGDNLVDLLTVAGAADLAGAKIEWEQISQKLKWLEKEFRWL